MAKVQNQLVASYQLWRKKPLAWVSDRFPGVALSSQQQEYFREFGSLVSAKMKAHDAPGTLNAAEDVYANKIGISIMAGQGVGKDFIAAMTMLYFLDVFPYCKITATGVTGKHLRNILWAECSKIMRLSASTNPQDHRAATVLEEIISWQTERIFHNGAKNKGAEWFAEAVTINPNANEEEQAKTLYGRHEDYQLIVVDEAAGVPEPVFGPLEGTLTRKCCIALMIFNPIKAKGYAYDSHHKNASQWVTARWSAEESELVSKEHIAKMERYGRESNTFRVKVLGLPPLMSDGGLIPYDTIMDAVGREFEVNEFSPVMCGVDCGGGGDTSVVAVRHGPMVELFQKSTADPDELEDWAAMTLIRASADVAFVDNIGLGWYLPKKLRNRNINARPADARGTRDLKDADKFLNKRAEMYWDLAQAFINRAISIPNDQDLIDELGAIKMETTGNKVKIEDKKAIRKRLGFSPDRADALSFTFFKADEHFRKGTAKKRVNSVDYSKVYLR